MKIPTPDPTRQKFASPIRLLAVVRRGWRPLPDAEPKPEADQAKAKRLTKRKGARN
jgi:hypothetical protein